VRTFRAVIRFAAFAAATFGLYGFYRVARPFIPNKTYWRQVIFGLWANSFQRISAMRLEISGTPPRPPFFLVSNHLGYADVAALRCAAKGVFVAKGEIISWPVIGTIIRDMGTIFIDRTNRRDIPRAGELIIKRVEAGEGVMIFPEGTNTIGEKILPFHSSFLQFAAESDLPVHYATISYRTPEGEPPAAGTISWGDDKTFFQHMFGLFGVREYTAVIDFGEQSVSGTDRKQLAAELYGRVSEKFDPML
jgi:1-acyl-sn-glycerol-3-phosphate acyltransferase